MAQFSKLMKDIKPTEKKSNHWVKKSLSFVLLLLASVAMGTTAFKTKPALEEIITSLSKEVANLKKEVADWKISAQTWMKRSNDFEHKFYEASRESLKKDAVKTYEQPKSKHVKERLTARDSARIADIIYEKKGIITIDSEAVYTDYLRKLIHGKVTVKQR